MGWTFRRSIKIGPFARLNVSTRGVGVSAGVRGARVSVGPRGTYVTFGRGGFQYRQKLSGSALRTPSSPAQLPSPATPGPSLIDPGGFITTASAAELAVSSPDESLANAQRQISGLSWFTPYLVFAFLGAVLTLCAGVRWLVIAYLFAVSAGAVYVYLWDRERRTARILYDVDDTEVVERLAMANAAGEWLKQTARMWHVYYSVPTNDWKYNAGATTLIQRTPTFTRPGSLELIELNIEPWSIPVGPQRLLFLPDRLLVQQGKQLAGVPYDQLSVRFRRSRFVEDGAVPPDATQVDVTWQYVNKSGGPDRRFTNNRQIPVLEYGDIELESPGGLRVNVQLSNANAAEAATMALQALIDRAVTATRAFDQAAYHALDAGVPIATPPRVPATATVHRTDTAPMDDHGALLEPLAVLLRYIAAADRRITEEEIQRAGTLLDRFAPGSPRAQQLKDSFRSIKSDSAAVSAALSALAQSPHTAQWAFDAASDLAHIDGRLTPKEKERLTELRALLTQ